MLISEQAIYQIVRGDLLSRKLVSILTYQIATEEFDI